MSYDPNNSTHVSYGICHMGVCVAIVLSCFEISSYRWFSKSLRIAVYTSFVNSTNHSFKQHRETYVPTDSSTRETLTARNLEATNINKWNRPIINNFIAAIKFGLRPITKSSAKHTQNYSRQPNLEGKEYQTSKMKPSGNSDLPKLWKFSVFPGRNQPNFKSLCHGAANSTKLEQFLILGRRSQQYFKQRIFCSVSKPLCTLCKIVDARHGFVDFKTFSILVFQKVHTHDHLRSIMFRALDFWCRSC